MNNSKSYNILISGAGQLGSRYLQGLVGINVPLNIIVHDINRESLEVAKKRWDEVNGSNSEHLVDFINVLDLLPDKIDIAIISTTASVRLEVIKKIELSTKVEFWILEKVLAQNVKIVNDIVSIIGINGNAWVNTPRRIMPWYKEIKSKLHNKNPMVMNVHGTDWGMACNSIHFLDLFSWFTNETVIRVLTDKLEPNWFESKRKGYWDLFGIMEISYSKGSRLVLSSVEVETDFVITTNDDEFEWNINESNRKAIRSDGLQIEGRIIFQSEFTEQLVESILQDGNCELPTLAESALYHNIFLKNMLCHWKKNMDPDSILVPIT